MEGQPRDRSGGASGSRARTLRRDLSDARRGRHRPDRPAGHRTGARRMKGFMRAGHLPTLIAALLYFDVSFMVWVLFGPLAPFLRQELGLTATEQGCLTAFPLLADRLFRPFLGALAVRMAGAGPGLSDSELARGT